MNTLTKNNSEYKFSEKDKTTALILSIFLGFWTWLYTYKKDSFKFWICLFFSGVTFGIFWFIAWIWAIVETVNRPKSFYENFSQYIFTMGNQMTDTDYGGVKNYKLNILLFEIRKRKRNVKIFSSKIFGNLKKILLPLIVGFSVLLIFAIMFNTKIIYTSWSHGVSVDYRGREYVNVSEDAMALSLIISLLIGIIFFFRIHNTQPKFIKRIYNRNLKEYEFHLEELEKSFPSVISDFGGMDMFKRLFK